MGSSSLQLDRRLPLDPRQHFWAGRVPEPWHRDQGLWVPPGGSPNPPGVGLGTAGGVWWGGGDTEVPPTSAIL